MAKIINSSSTGICPVYSSPFLIYSTYSPALEIIWQIALINLAVYPNVESIS